MASEQASLARDAWRRLLRNRFAVAGGVFVFLMAVLGAAAPLISRYLTHFAYDEQHPQQRLRPPGTKDVSHTFPTYDGDQSHFAKLDRDGDGKIGGERELGQLFWLQRYFEFLFADYDLVRGAAKPTATMRRDKPAGCQPDDRISRPEFPEQYQMLDPIFRREVEAYLAKRPQIKMTGEQFVAKLGLTSQALFKQIDANGDGSLTRNEVAAHRRIYRPFATASSWKPMDIDGSGFVERSEYPGAPKLRVFLLGTDRLGRDVATRLFYGARISLLVGVLATLVSFLIGVTWGAFAGFYGGRVDSLMMRIVDVLYGLPFMFVVILLIVVFGRSTINLFLALGAVQWLTMSRVVRGQVLSLRAQEFVTAARALGIPRYRIVTRHLLRNTVGPVIVYSTLLVPAVILEETFLSFLGLGVQPPLPSWGNMINEGVKVMENYAWLILAPTAMLGVTLFAMNFFGDGLRDALDPNQGHG